MHSGFQTLAERCETTGLGVAIVNQDTADIILVPQRQIGITCMCHDGMSEGIADLTRHALKQLLTTTVTLSSNG